MALAQRPLIFSFDLSPKASNFSISRANWLLQVILCTIILSKVRNSILGISMGLKLLSPKDQKNYILTQCPHSKMQSLTKRPNTFSVFLSPDALGCENRCPIPISISYMSVPKIMPFLCASVSK